MHKRQIQQVETRIGLQLFPALQQQIEESLSKLIDTAFDNVRDELRSDFQRIQHGIVVWVEGAEDHRQASLHNANFAVQVKQLLTKCERVAQKLDTIRTTTTQAAATYNLTPQ